MGLDTSPQSSRCRLLDPGDEHVVRRVLSRCGLSGPDLEDSVQDVRLRVWRCAPADQQLTRWVACVARNVAMDHHRAARRRQELTARLAFTLAPASTTPDPATRMAVSRALRHISPEHREVISLRFLAGLSLREAAAVLAVPEGTVKSRTSRALAALKLQLEEGQDLRWTA